MTIVDFLGPGSNIFPGMSGKESDWSEGQLLRNTNHIDRMMALKIPRCDCSLCLTFSTELHLSESFMKVRQTISVRLAIKSRGRTFSSASRLEKARVYVLLLCLLSRRLRLRRLPPSSNAQLHTRHLHCRCKVQQLYGFIRVT